MIWLPIVGNYADIDAYASILAYADLLNQRGKTARTYIPMAPNYSVPEELRLPDQENATFDFQSDDEAIILDVSIPEAINRLIPDGQILEIIDHHPGYETYWQERIGNKAIIEKIGAVATSIFEWWGECWDYDKISPQIARLLLGAILDNTLNFTANTTTKRDHFAATKLAEIANTTLADYTTWYFSAVSNAIISDLPQALLNDCKPLKSPLDSTSILGFGQLTLWAAKDIIKQQEQIQKIMNANYTDWIVSIVCISEQKNYILTSSSSLDSYFTKLLGLKKQNQWLVSNHLYLRKEIIGKVLVASSQDTL